MDLATTLWIAGALAAFAAFAGWRGARQPNPHRGPRMVPWRFLMLLSVAILVLVLVHAVNLMGMRTGR